MKNNNNTSSVVLNHIAAIKQEKDIDKRVGMLHQLNELLPTNKKLQLPSLFTNAYIRKAIDTVEERL
jgi:hypothetical protein